MAIYTPLLRKVRVLAAKIETTPGTVETLTAAEGTFNVFNPVMQCTTESREREGQGSFTPLANIPEGRTGTISFQTEAWSATTTPIWASVFMPCCGTKETSSVFAPLCEAPGTNLKTCTIGLYENGRYKKIRGCSGTAIWNFVSGKVVTIDWTFTGIWDAPTDASILAPTYVTTTPLRFASSGLVLNSNFNPSIESMTIDMGNEVFLREDPSDVSGYIYAMITGRKVMVKMNPDATLVATKDWYGEFLASTQQAMALTLGNANNQLAIAAPKLTHLTAPQDADRNGLIVDELEFQCCRSAAAGNDEITFDFNEDA